MKTSKLLVLLAASAMIGLAGLSGCAGGCGEDSSKPGAGAGGGGPEMSAVKGGSGSAPMSRYDSAGKKSTGTLSELSTISTDISAPPVAKVGPDDFKARVLRAGATVFLTVVRPDCPDCETVAPVLKTLAPDFSGKYEFMQYDGAAVGASGLLPKGVSLEPLPAFVMYKDGKATSWIQGLPFPREVDSQGAPTGALEDYQRRLMRWFHDALMQKNLNFSRTLRKTPAKKT